MATQSPPLNPFGPPEAVKLEDVTVLKYFVRGDPVGKGRPRFARRGPGVYVYAPPKTVDWETKVTGQTANALLRTKIRSITTLPFQGRVEADFIFFLPRPKSSKPEKEPHRLKKPDVDNLIKSMLDGMQGLVFDDDKVVTDVSGSKRYADDDMEPGVMVRVTLHD